MNAVFIKGKQKLKQHSMIKYSLHYETTSFRNIYPLFLKIYIFELVIISAIPLVVEKWITLVLGLEALNFIQYTYSVLFSYVLKYMLPAI